MSKPTRTFLLSALLAIFLQPFKVIQAQSAVFDIKSGATPSVSVRLIGERGRDLSFIRSVAGVDGLHLRVSNVRLADFATGISVPFRELQRGEYLAEAPFSQVTYDVDLSPLKERSAAAHASWMNDDVGILMLADVLPRSSARSLTASFPSAALPVESIEFERGQQSAQVRDVENSVFFVGRGWRMRKTERCWECPTLFVSGTWLFTDDEAVNLISEVTDEYRTLFGTHPSEPLYVQIGIAKFPVPTEPGIWQAETRGRTVTIISSDMPFRTQSLQRLHEQLRHELFHLWIPNRLSLTGNYDWFYEGFALYKSLKLAVAMNRIRFEDFLDTLSRAHTIDSAYTQRSSLIEASKNRFGGTSTQVYARGMLIAFVTDLLLLGGSKGSVDDLLKQVYAGHRKPAPEADGNKAVMEIMQANPALAPIVRKYIAGSETINWREELTAAGLEDVDGGPATTLRVKEKLRGRQKAVLDKLGYNNWRKLPASTK